MVSLYQRGRNYEYKAIHELESSGYIVVRSAASHGLFDIWALGEVLRLIQIKAEKDKKSYNRLIKQLSEVKVPYFCQVELWVWHDRKGWSKYIVRKSRQRIFLK